MSDGKVVRPRDLPVSRNTSAPLGEEVDMSRVVLPSVAFYVQAVGHMSRAAFKAACGRLDNADLVKGSHALRRSLESVGVRFEISGLDRVDWQGGPYVFVANHMSALETQILPSILERAAPCTFVVKSSLLRYPILGPVLRGFDPITVDRADPRTDLRRVIEAGTERLRRGMSVIVFPQAHRTATFSRKSFNSIGMRLARAAGVPMVPIALDTATWMPGRLIKDIGWIVPERPARFAFGEAIATAADGATAHREVMNFIEARLAEWEAIDSNQPAPIPDDAGDALAIRSGAGPVTPSP